MSRAWVPVVGRSRVALVLLALLTVIVSDASPAEPPLTFPRGFLWGAATAAHQVEGGNTNNDWAEWERIGRLQEPAGIASDHWRRFAEDLDLAGALRHTAYRMSLEWSRIEPTPGAFDDAAIRHYRTVIATARARGMRTFVTLHHFTNPQWAAARGGWADPAMPEWFARYVEHVVPQLHDVVDHWITVNEPNVNAITSYLAGATPPGLRDRSLVGPVLANFLKAHARAYRAIHRIDPDASVGLAHHMRAFDPSRWWHPLDHLIAKVVSAFWNEQILDAITSGRIRFDVPLLLSYDERWPELAGTLDFIGLNYYTRDLIRSDLGQAEGFALEVAPGSARSDLGWEIYPEGLGRSLRTLKRYGLPVYVTENGVADASDARRASFICDHLKQVLIARQDGVDVRGYLHWALIDNYEWLEGSRPRFGLIEVDYATQQRRVRESARAYTAVIAAGSIAPCR